MSPIAAARMANQRLVGRPFRSPAAAVSWLGAVQGQEYAFAKWALSLRTGLTDARIEAAFNRGDILRTHVLRPTWHFVAPADIRWMLALTGPRIRAGSRVYAQRLEIDASLERRAFKVFERALTGNALTRSEIKDALRRARVDAVDPARCALLLMFAELAGLVTSGPRRENAFTYALVDERVPAAADRGRDEALGELATRYFQSRRPATVRDFVWWSGLTTADARRAIDIARVKTDAGSAKKKPGGTVVHLLPIYDEYPLSYRDRSAASAGPRPRGSFDTIFVHLLLINGLVEGFWTRELSERVASIAVKPFRPLTKSEWRLVEDAGERHAKFLGRSVKVSRRV